MRGSRASPPGTQAANADRARHRSESRRSAESRSRRDRPGSTPALRRTPAPPRAALDAHLAAAVDVGIVWPGDVPNRIGEGPRSNNGRTAVVTPASAGPTSPASRARCGTTAATEDRAQSHDEQRHATAPTRLRPVPPTRGARGLQRSTEQRLWRLKVSGRQARRDGRMCERTRLAAGLPAGSRAPAPSRLGA